MDDEEFGPVFNAIRFTVGVAVLGVFMDMMRISPMPLYHFLSPMLGLWSSYEIKESIYVETPAH